MPNPKGGRPSNQVLYNKVTALENENEELRARLKQNESGPPLFDPKTAGEKDLMIMALKVKLGAPEPEGVKLPPVMGNLIAEQAERDLTELNKSFNKRVEEEVRKAGGRVPEKPPIPIKPGPPQDDKPCDCNRCGVRVPDRTKGAKQYVDGMWYCLACWPEVAK